MADSNKDNKDNKDGTNSATNATTSSGSRHPASNASGGGGSSSALQGGSSDEARGEPPRRALDEAEAAEQEAMEQLEESGHPASWGAPSNALHGLLRKLGAGLDDLLPSISASHSKLKTILAGLKADDDGRQLAALSELCELLSIGTRVITPSLRVRAPPPPSSSHLSLF